MEENRIIDASKPFGIKRLAASCCCIYICILAICFISTPCFAASYFYTAATSSWVDISTTGTAVTLSDDSNSSLINLGFSFIYGNTSFSQISIGSNGYIALGAVAAQAPYTNTSLPQTTIQSTNIILPFWDDLDASAGGQVLYKSIGTAPNRSFVVTYNAVALYDYPSEYQTVQVVLNENGTFQFNYKTTTAHGNSATIGYQVSSSDFVQYSFNTSIPNNTSILWRQQPILSNKKSMTVVSDPINNTTLPKLIPGAIVDYTLQITNTGYGYVDNNSVALVDNIPPNISLFSGGLSGSTPYIFTNGSPSSTLTCPFVSLSSITDCVDFSNNNGSTWTYTPNGSYDSSVTNIRFKPSGTMAGVATVGGSSPSFSIKFRGLVK